MILPRKLFPLLSGYSLKNYYLIQILAQRYSITLIVISNEHISEEEKEFYQTYTRKYLIYPLSKWESVFGVFKACIKGHPIQVGLYSSRRLMRLVAKYSQKADVFICELVRTLPYLQKAETSAVKVFDMVDSIGLNYQKSIEGTRSFLWRCYYRVEASRLLRYEKRGIEISDITFLFNSDEQKYWSNAGNVHCLPHGVKEGLLDYPRSGQRENYVVFIGKMNYQPNIDAVMWYVNTVHRKMKRRIPLIITGAYPVKEIVKLQEENEDITVTGFVEDPYTILEKAAAVIAPMQTGGGIQNKVLEAMALGKVNLLSAKAARPITGAVDGKHFFICDTREEYEQRLKELISSPEKAEQMGTCARQFICEHYTWERYGKQYLSCLEQLYLQQKVKG